MREKTSKRRNGLVVLLAVLLAVCSLCLGLSLFVGDKLSQQGEALPAFAEDTVYSTVDISASPTSVPRGGTMTLTVTISSTRPNAVWASVSLFLGPLSADGTLSDVNKYLSYDTGTATYDSIFSDRSYKISVVDKFNTASGQGAGYLNISVAAQFTDADPDINVSVNTPIVLTIPIKVSEDLPNDVTSLDMGFRLAKTNKITTMASKGIQDTDIAVGQTAAQGVLGLPTPVNVGIKEAGNNATLKSIKLGGAASTLTAPTGGIADSMTWKGDMPQGSVIVNPEATDANASIYVNTSNSFPDSTKVTSGGNSSALAISNGTGTVYVHVVAEDGTTTKDYTVSLTNTYARLDGTVTDISTNSTTTGTKNTGWKDNGKKFNDNTNAEQIYYVPSDASGNNAITFRVKVKTGLGIQNSVGISGSGVSVSTTTLAGVIDSTGGTFNASNITEDSTITLTTLAADASTTYVYTIKFKILSVDASLSDVHVISGGNKIEQLANQSTETNYTFDMPAINQYKGTLNITPTQSSAKVLIGTGAYNASTVYTAPTTVNFTVEAPAGNTKAYTATLKKEAVGSGEFTNIEYSTDGINYSPVFTSSDYDAQKLEFTLRLNMASFQLHESVRFRVTKSNALVQVSGTGDILEGNDVWLAKVGFGENKYTLTAAIADGGSTVYSFKVILTEDKNTIENIDIKDQDNTALEGYTFVAGTKNYTVEVPYGTSAVTLTVGVDGSYTMVRSKFEGKDNIHTGIGSRKHEQKYDLKVGDNVFEIRAISNGDLGSAVGNGLGVTGEIYTVTVKRQAASTNNKLESLSVSINGTVLDFMDNNKENTVTFDPDTNSYYVFSDDGAANAVISAKAQDDFAVISGINSNQGNINVNISGLGNAGSIVIQDITVTAQNGDVNTYKVYIANSPIVLDTNYDIISIELEGNNGEKYFVNADFNPDTLTYTIDVPYAIDRITAFVEAFQTATVYVDGTKGISSKELTVGSNTLEIWAVAQDETTNANGAEKKYVFTINRAEANKNVFLKDISVNGTTVDGFDRDKADYVVRLPHDAASARLRVEAEDEHAVISVYRNGLLLIDADGYVECDIDLTDADITVTVTLNVALDGTSKPYTVRLSKASAKPILTYLNVAGYDIYLDGFEQGNKVDIENPDPVGITDLIYYIKIASGLYSLPVIAKTNDLTASMRIESHKGTPGECEVDINVDEFFGNLLERTIHIVIRPESGADSIYDLVIRRDPTPTSNTNAEIEIDELDDLYGFNAEYVENKDSWMTYGPYSVTHLFTVLTIRVTPEVENDYTAPATYQIFYNRVLMNDNGTVVDGVELGYGANNIEIIITSSDKTAKRSVGVTVVRGDIAMDAVSITEISAFEDAYKKDVEAGKYVDTYYYSVGNNVSKLTFTVTMADGLSYVIANADNLKVGMNEVYIYLYDSEIATTEADSDADPVKTITLYVNREAKSNELWSIFFWVLLALVIVELLIIILMAVVIHKKSKASKNPPSVTIQMNEPEPLPQPMQPIQQLIQPVPIVQPIQQLPIQQMPIQPMPMQQPVQYVQQMPMQQMPMQQPVQAQPAPEEHKRPVNVQVKITGMGDNDGTYDQGGKR